MPHSTLHIKVKSSYLLALIILALSVVQAPTSNAVAKSKPHIVNFMNMTKKTIDIYFNTTKVATVKPYSHQTTTAMPGSFMVYAGIGKKFFEKVSLFIDPKKDGENAIYYYNVLGFGSFAIFDITGFYTSENSLVGAIADQFNHKFKLVASYVKKKVFVFKSSGIVLNPASPLLKNRVAFTNVYQMLPISPKWQGDAQITKEAYKMFEKKLKNMKP
jgi:hypothetical protein